MKYALRIVKCDHATSSRRLDRALTSGSLFCHAAQYAIFGCIDSYDHTRRTKVHRHLQLQKPRPANLETGRRRTEAPSAAFTSGRTNSITMQFRKAPCTSGKPTEEDARPTTMKGFRKLKQLIYSVTDVRSRSALGSTHRRRRRMVAACTKYYTGQSSLSGTTRECCSQLTAKSGVRLHIIYCVVQFNYHIASPTGVVHSVDELRWFLIYRSRPSSPRKQRFETRRNDEYCH